MRVDSCRSCADHFEYHVPDGGVFKIIAGPPKVSKYKAVSYLWGATTQDILVTCTHCRAETCMPMASLAKFHRILEMVGDEMPVWLDALSIDQRSHEDKTRQMGMMGTIYKNARWVSVLLPPGDLAAMRLLHCIATIGRALLSFEASVFRPFYDDELISKEQCDEFEAICKETNVYECLVDVPEDEKGFVLYGTGDADPRNIFSRAVWSLFQRLRQFEENIHTWAYWRRAWTFQEWALASRIEVAVEEASPQDATGHQNATDVKQIIVRTAVMLTSYHMPMQGGLKCGMDSAGLFAALQVVKRLFPDEDTFVQDYEVDPQLYKNQCMFPLRWGSDLALGLRARPLAPESNTDALRRRVYLMLNALASSKREARYDADLVACWASMCNIMYPYSPQDSFMVALQKAVRVLRARGVCVFNFHCNTVAAGGTVDATFLDYAAECLQNVTISKAKMNFHGAPAFTGRVDTCMHFRMALANERNPTALETEGVALQRVVSPCEILSGPCHPLPKGWSPPRVVGGRNLSTAETDELQRTARDIPASVLERFKFVELRILAYRQSLDSERIQTGVFSAWAICENNSWDHVTKVFPARESLNGTLVLATTRAEQVYIIAYLVISDSWQTGSYLVRCDEQGEINIRLRENVSPSHSFRFDEGTWYNHPFLVKDPAWDAHRDKTQSGFTNPTAPPDWYFTASVRLENSPSLVSYGCDPSRGAP